MPLADRVRQFVFEPADPRPLAFLRIGVGAIALLQVLLLWPYLLQLYGNYGFIQWAVIETAADMWLPSIGKVCLLLQPLGISSSAVVYAVFALYAASVVGLLLGWKTRICAVAAWLLHSLTVNSGYISLYGVDTMLHICLFYCAWMPVGDALSLDRRARGGPAAPSAMARISMRTLQIHLCIIYLSTAIAKLRGVQWRNGEAIWRATMQPQFAVFDMSWLASAPLIARLMCWYVIVIELGYAFLIWHPRTRRVWVVGIVALHFGIGIVLGLWLFSTMMIVMNVAAFGFGLFSLARLENRSVSLPVVESIGS